MDVLLLSDADDQLVPAEEHDHGAAGDERAGAEQAAGREVALENRHVSCARCGCFWRRQCGLWLVFCFSARPTLP